MPAEPKLTPAMPALCVPTNLRDDLLDRLDWSRIAEVYGKLPSDPMGGGRATLVLPHASRRDAVRHIRRVRDRGVSFNYLLNATCLDNLEFTRRGRARVDRAIAFAVDAGADCISVSIPQVLEIIKRRHPGVKVSVSTMAGIASPETARHWERLGADRLTLSVTDVNRDFARLAAIRQAVKVRLQVIANLECLRGCPFTRYHGNLNSHASQEDHVSGGLVLDYCYLSCSIARLEEPARYLMAGFVRPEDQRHYAAAGVGSIKLVNRAMTSEQIALIVKAYTQARHEGNLLDLFSHPSRNEPYARPRLLAAAARLLKPARINVLDLWRFRDLFQWPQPAIDNRALEGFIDQFVSGRCDVSACGTGCRHCHQAAQRAFSMDETARQQALARLRAFRERLLDGSLFHYFSA